MGLNIELLSLKFLMVIVKENRIIINSCILILRNPRLDGKWTKSSTFWASGKDAYTETKLDHQSSSDESFVGFRMCKWY